MHILQTRPQGEKSAVEALERRGVGAVSPTETVRVRRRRRGKDEYVDKQIRLTPGYVMVTPNTSHDLDRALGDMDLREPRRDVLRVVGRIATRFDEDAVSRIIKRHGGVVEQKVADTVKVGDLAKIVDGPMKEFQARVLAVRGNKAVVQCGPFPAEVSLDHLVRVDPQRHPPT